MARKQLQNNHIAAIPFHHLQSRYRWHYFAWTNIYGTTAAEFSEYGGTQNRPEYDVMPVDMPPMVSSSIVGI